MLIERHIKRIRKLEQSYGANEGACFGTSLLDHLRPALRSFQDRPKETVVYSTENPNQTVLFDSDTEPSERKSRISKEEMDEAMRKGQELRREFAKEQEEAHRFTAEELHRRYD